MGRTGERDGIQIEPRDGDQGKEVWYQTGTANTEVVSVMQNMQAVNITAECTNACLGVTIPTHTAPPTMPEKSTQPP